MKGYGFITDEQDQDYFLHSHDLDVTLKPAMVQSGLRVKFDVKNDLKGDKAIRVRKA